MLTACNMNELESVNRMGDRIGFMTTTGGMTKAVDVTTANLTGFTVEAFNHNTVVSPYMNAVAFTGAAGTFESAEPYYWPEGALDFYAYSQGAAEGQVVKSDYRTFTVTPAASPSAQADFVFAGTTNKTKAGSTNGAIALNFRHTESKIMVKVKNSAPNMKFQITGWRVGYLDTDGTFTYNGNEDHPYDATTDAAGTLAAGMWSGNTTFSASNKYTSDFTASAVNVAVNASDAVSLPGEMILVPQVTTAADAYASNSENALVNGSYVAVEMKAMNNDANSTVIQSKIWAIWPVAFAWEPGKSYTYTIDLAGGGYYEQNNDDGSDDLDPILEGAVISFASVTVDDFAQQSNIAVPKLTPDIEVVVEDITVGGLAIVEVNIPTTGTCDIYLNNTIIGDGLEINAGKIEFPISGLSAGTYTVTVHYNGNELYDQRNVSTTFEVSDI